MTVHRAANLGDIAGGLIKKWEKSPSKKGSNVIAAWNSAVGEKAMGRAKPVAYKKGTITVVTENPAWQYKMAMEKRNILERFNKHYKGRIKARDIKFRVGIMEEN